MHKQRIINDFFVEFQLTEKLSNGNNSWTFAGLSTWIMNTLKVINEQKMSVKNFGYVISSISFGGSIYCAMRKFLVASGVNL